MHQLAWSFPNPLKREIRHGFGNISKYADKIPQTRVFSRRGRASSRCVNAHISTPNYAVVTCAWCSPVYSSIFAHLLRCIKHVQELRRAHKTMFWQCYWLIWIMNTCKPHNTIDMQLWYCALRNATESTAVM